MDPSIQHVGMSFSKVQDLNQCVRSPFCHVSSVFILRTFWPDQFSVKVLIFRTYSLVCGSVCLLKTVLTLNRCFVRPKLIDFFVNVIEQPLPERPTLGIHPFERKNSAKDDLFNHLYVFSLCHYAEGIRRPHENTFPLCKATFAFSLVSPNPSISILKKKAVRACMQVSPEESIAAKWRDVCKSINQSRTL